ncbi:uncharacterized protein BcabD6B2_39590 [Babesia caballi]|uniref:Uncharacterized protein n=1 Tax=Babesia caballi TaxID=5871 RepID=A0AAV4LWS6_BABCB|nr:hypothetical protein, conserved [Babesia caballi]
MVRLGGIVSILHLTERCRLQLSSYNLSGFGSYKIFLCVPKGYPELFEILFLVKPLRSPPACALTPPVQVGEAEIHDRHDTNENSGTVLMLRSLKALPLGVSLTVGGGDGRARENTGSRFNKRFKTVGQTFNKRF